MFSTMFLRNSVKRMFPKVSMMSQWRRFACTVTENPWGYKEDRWKVPILFESRREIAPDTYILRFKFEDPSRCLGTKLGQNIKLHIDLGEDNEISRFYTPISPVDQQGVVEFVLKEIKDINTLSMSQMLSKLNPRHVKNLGVIAEGSGIGAFMQIIRAVATEQSKAIRSNLLFIHPTPKDIIFHKEFREFEKNGTFKCNFLIQRDFEGFKDGFTGAVTKEIIEKVAPKPGNDSLVCVCGQRANKELSIKYLKELGFDDTMIYV